MKYPGRWPRIVVIVLAAAVAAGCSSTTASTATSSASSATSAASSAPSASAATSAAPSASSATTRASAAPATADQGGPGDIPDNQVFVVFTPASGGLTVKVPEGWARSDGPTGMQFSDKYNSVQIESRPMSTAPTIASATGQELQAVKAAGGNVAGDSVSSVERSSGPAILIAYEVDSPVNEVTGKSVRLAAERYEFWHAGTEVVLTLSGAVGADNVDPWRTITDSLTWSS